MGKLERMSRRAEDLQKEMKHKDKRIRKLKQKINTMEMGFQKIFNDEMQMMRMLEAMHSFDYNEFAAATGEAQKIINNAEAI